MERDETREIPLRLSLSAPARSRLDYVICSHFLLGARVPAERNSLSVSFICSLGGSTFTGRTFSEMENDVARRRKIRRNFHAPCFALLAIAQVSICVFSNYIDPICRKN
jgi:hypothetical protein